MQPFRVGFVTGATPDKWARTWRERRPREPLELVPVTEAEQETGVRDGSLDMCLVRLPVDRDVLHCIPLYDETPVVVVPLEHLVTAADEIALADLVDEQLVLPHSSGWTPEVPQLDFPPMEPQDAVEVVASGTGVVIVPMSVARLHRARRRPPVPSSTCLRPGSGWPGSSTGTTSRSQRSSGSSAGGPPTAPLLTPVVARGVGRHVTSWWRAAGPRGSRRRTGRRPRRGRAARPGRRARRTCRPSARPAQILSIRSSTPGRAGSRYIREDEMPSS